MGATKRLLAHYQAIYQIDERREVPISTEVAVNAIPKGIPPASRIGAQLPEVTGEVKKSSQVKEAENSSQVLDFLSLSVSESALYASLHLAGCT